MDRVQALTTNVLAIGSYHDQVTHTQVDKILEAIHALGAEIQAHQVTRDARWQLLQSLGLHGNDMC
jgi:hypothetical protein